MSEITAKILTKVIKKRPSNSHKGNYGRILLIGGNENYGGAIIMAAEAALNSGAGLISVATHPVNLNALRAALIVLTPYQMEWQRLSQIRIPYQTDSANLSALKKIFPTQNVILVLKSNRTHVYTSTNEIFVNTSGNPGMATGGMGDTLAGIIGGFIAQFGGTLDPVLAAIYLHSLAGDKIAETDYVVRPTKISAILPQLMKQYADKG